MKLGHLAGALYFVASLLIFIMISGCSSIRVISEQDRIDYIIKTYEPPVTTTQILSLHEIHGKYGNGVNGAMTASGGVIKTYKVESRASAVTLLHEYCHILQPDFHRGHAHSGLDGCNFFSLDTLNEV